MKKFLSLLIVAAMVFTSFTGVFAATITNDNPATLTITVEEAESPLAATTAAINTFLEDNVIDDYVIYRINLVAGNLPALERVSSNSYNGEGVVGALMTMDVTVEGDEDSEWTLKAGSGSGGFTGNRYSWYVGNDENVQDGKATLLQRPGVEANATSTLASFDLVVADGYELSSIEFIGGSLVIASYTTGNKYNQGSSAYAVVNDPAGGVTNLTIIPVTYPSSGGGGGEDPETYIVEFLDYDGVTQLGYGDDYEEGDSVTAPADPTRLGWTFTGWSDGVNTYAGNAIPAVGNDNVTYTATYSQNNYTIIFRDWDNSEISSDSTYVYGATVTPPADPTRPDYTFAGWDPAVVTVTADATYTATYTKDPVYAESITITGDTLTNVSTTVQLDYETVPGEVEDTVAWEIVSGPATINDSGLVTPTGVGVVEVQITASPSGKTDTHTIKVVADAVAPTVEETNPYLTATDLVEKKYDDGNYYHVSDATISSADTTNYIYKAWAKEYGSEEKHYFELPEDIDAVNEFLNVESSGAALNFILMIKSATHKIIAAGIDAFLDK